MSSLKAQTWFVLLSLAILLSCSTPRPASRERAPATAQDEMLCSRIKETYARESGAHTNRSYDVIARGEAEAMYDATVAFATDTTTSFPDGRPRSCEAVSVHNLIKAPNGCPNWNGPYLSADLIAKYGNMLDIDFKAFITCWKQ